MNRLICFVCVLLLVALLLPYCDGKISKREGELKSGIAERAKEAWRHYKEGDNKDGEYRAHHMGESPHKEWDHKGDNQDQHKNWEHDKDGEHKEGEHKNWEHNKDGEHKGDWEHKDRPHDGEHKEWEHNKDGEHKDWEHSKGGEHKDCDHNNGGRPHDGDSDGKKDWEHHEDWKHKNWDHKGGEHHNWDHHRGGDHHREWNHHHREGHHWNWGHGCRRMEEYFRHKYANMTMHFVEYGLAPSVYVVLADKGIEVKAVYETVGNTTAITKVGVKVGEKNLIVTTKGDLVIDGVESNLKEFEPIALETGSIVLERRGKLVVTHGPYHIFMKVRRPWRSEEEDSFVPHIGLRVGVDKSAKVTPIGGFLGARIAVDPAQFITPDTL